MMMEKHPNDELMQLRRLDFDLSSHFDEFELRNISLERDH
jgi:hypothetical protein